MSAAIVVGGWLCYGWRDALAKAREERALYRRARVACTVTVRGATAVDLMGQRCGIECARTTDRVWRCAKLRGHDGACTGWAVRRPTFGGAS